MKGLYTEVRNVQHVARGRVSRVFAPLIGKVMDDKNKKNPLKRMGAKPLVLGFRFGLIRASS